MNSAIADREKEWKREVQKFEYIENKRSFFREIKNIFHNCLSAFLAKYLNIADTGFKVDHVVNITLSFKNWFPYNYLILIR